MTYQEFCEKYPPSEELKQDCLYEHLDLKRRGKFSTVNQLIEKAMLEEYTARYVNDLKR